MIPVGADRNPMVSTSPDPGTLPTMDTTTNDFSTTSSATAAAAGIRCVVVPTDDESDALARARRAALQLARRHGWRIVLYDRTGERWTDTPHPVGTLAADEIDESERPHLVRQLADLEAAGVPSSAFLATVPALTAMIDVVQEIDVDAVLMPDELDKPRVMDRLQIGDGPGEMVARVAKLQLGEQLTISRALH